MAISKERIQYLLKAWSSQTATVAEESELIEAVTTGGTEEEIRTHIQQLVSQYQSETLPQVDWQNLYQQIKLKAGIEERPVRRMGWKKWVAAACILIVTGYVLWVTMDRRSQVAVNKEQVAKQDVPAPTNTRAVITLANGSKVYLDSAGNGILAQENNVAVVRNADGSIEYNRKDAKTQGETAYNTLYNPRGSKVISLTLSDGTKVWLNSESSLRYPASFASSAVNREVEITGEAYFEVKHNAKQPFKVHLPNGPIVEDLGTAFNINSYTDESSIKTTLIEGSVRITAANAATAAVKIKPGQQAVLDQANPKISRIEVQTNVNVDEVTAWKNGTFNYSNADLPTIMRQMARWYDVEVEYKDKITDRYTVDVPRNVPVSQLFKFIEMSGGVKFEINGKKIIVSK